MAGLDEVFKTMQRTQNLIKSAGLASQLAQINDAVSFANNSTVMKLIKMTEGFKAPFAPLYDIQESLSKNFDHVQKFKLPVSVYDSFNVINQRHSQFYQQWRSISQTLDWTMKATQINSLNAALGYVASQFALLNAAKGDWKSVEDFEEITAEVATISERVFENEIITKQDLKEIKALLQTIDKKDKNVEAIIWKWIAIISFILTLISEGRNWIPKPDAATKEDIEIMKKEFIDQIHQLQKETNDNRITNRVCKVYLKPNSKRIIATLPEQFDVVILQINHKWAYITYLNPKDNSTETGWVMKKYLSIEK